MHAFHGARLITFTWLATLMFERPDFSDFASLGSEGVSKRLSV
jgi:hypothetical protein